MPDTVMLRAWMLWYMCWFETGGDSADIMGPKNSLQPLIIMVKAYLAHTTGAMSYLGLPG